MTNSPAPKHTPEWTPEPWLTRTIVNLGCPDLHSIWHDEKEPHLDVMIARTCFAPQSKANAARIVTCVNSMAGVADPENSLRLAREALERIATETQGLRLRYHKPDEMACPLIEDIAKAALRALTPEPK